MKYYLIAGFMLLAGCGIEVHGTVDPVTITHKVQIDLDGVTSYCNSSCVGKYPDSTIDAQKCSSDCFNNFLEVLAHAGV